MIAKTILGIVLGDVIFAGGSALLFYAVKMDPHAPAPTRFIVLSSLAGIVLALVGGLVAGWIGRRADLTCGLILAVIIAGGAIVSLIGKPGAGAVWSQMIALLLMSPAALAGDWLRLRKSGSTV
ncbi:MAG TPA: hypothetical protein VJW20_09270 [Candidatus Angelobacter sp.]|nr:hypothetical protein [Candidatus Angelobacter sp.]